MILGGPEVLAKREQLIGDLKKRLPKTSVVDLAECLSYRLVSVFRELVLRDIFDYPNQTLSRSNFTYHIATALKESAKIVGLGCRFEAMGRRDAVVETTEGDPYPIAFLEWEWQFSDVFGAGKELEKLYQSVREYDLADAVLLTFCPQEEYLSFLLKIIQFWQSKFDSGDQPVLYPMIFAFELEGNSRNLSGLRVSTVGSKANGVGIWEYFDYED